MERTTEAIISLLNPPTIKEQTESKSKSLQSSWNNSKAWHLNPPSSAHPNKNPKRRETDRRVVLRYKIRDFDSP